jgi:hypothetical protein
LPPSQLLLLLLLLLWVLPQGMRARSWMQRQMGGAWRAGL